MKIDISSDLTLAAMSDADATALIALVDANRERLKSWHSWLDKTRTEAEALGFIQHARKEAGARKGAVFGIFFRGVLVGVCSFNEISSVNRMAKVGYWIGGSHEGRGIVLASVRALVDWGFGELGLNRIEIRCASENVRSQRIPERLGFRLEGILRQAEKLPDRFVDHRLYAMLRKEWRALQHA